MVYDIPGITTSVADRSYPTATELGGRSVLIAGFSKFGEEDFHEYSDPEKMKFSLGEIDLKKYGLGLFFAYGALSKTRNVIFRRLLPQDATFANLVFKDQGDGVSVKSISSVIQKDAFYETQLNKEDTFSVLNAKHRGTGYNNIYVRFSPASDFEKYFADKHGNVKYRFNFLSISIFEESSSGVKTKSNEFVISLIDTDPDTNVPLVDPLMTNELFANKKFSQNNEYADFLINVDKLELFKKDLNINDLTADYKDGVLVKGLNRVILKDTETGKNFEVTADKEGRLILRATILDGKDKMYTKVNVNGNDILKSIYITNGKFNIETDVSGSGTEKILPEFHIDGEDSFWVLQADEDSTSGIKTFKYVSERQKLYNLLTSGKSELPGLWRLKSGSDGSNLVINNTLNFDSSNAEVGKENAKQLLINFFDQDQNIREVIYPELDFDYIPDWTEDIDVQEAIVKLADDIGITMPLISFKGTRNYTDDYKRRLEDLYFSSYNTMIYSGQSNLNHYVPETGQIISCPASYYAMLDHLTIDNNMSITEPVANMNKGELPVAGVQLSYIAKTPVIAKLRAVQINTIIKETDGIYFIDQLTAYKNASKLSRANVVKVIHRMRKDIPRLLKDLLQLKAINDITGRAEARVREYMDKWKATQDNVVDGIFESIEVNSVFISEEFKLIISIAVVPIGTIEKIEIPITVL